MFSYLYFLFNGKKFYPGVTDCNQSIRYFASLSRGYKLKSSCKSHFVSISGLLHSRIKYSSVYDCYIITIIYNTTVFHWKSHKLIQSLSKPEIYQTPINTLCLTHKNGFPFNIICIYLYILWIKIIYILLVYIQYFTLAYSFWLISVLWEWNTQQKHVCLSETSTAPSLKECQFKMQFKLQKKILYIQKIIVSFFCL